MTSAQVIDGKAISEKVNAATREEVRAIVESTGVTPGLAVILVGENPASQVYVSRKVKMCEEIGVHSEKIVLPAETTQTELLDIIAKLNADNSIHGILVQSPTPKHISEQAVVEAIDPSKDADCFHPCNVGKMMLGDLNGFLPCTPWGVTVLLEETGIETAGKDIVILGRSNIVGKPMAALLLAKAKAGNATVTICHSMTKDVAAHTRRADIIIAAIGKPEFLTGDMVKEGVVVIDVGINRIPCAAKKTGFKLVGDVKFDEVAQKASFITPVPGGVGPMTIAMLMKNAVRGCRFALEAKR